MDEGERATRGLAGEEFDAYLRQVRHGCRRACELADRIEAGDVTALPLLKDAWIETELPSYCPDSWSRAWRAVRAAPDPSAVMSASERRRLRALPDRITVFRGVTAGGEHGWAWSVDRSVAEDFAVRYTGLGDDSDEPRLCIVEIHRSQVIAYFHIGHEHEVIIDPEEIDWSDVVVESLRPPRPAR